MINFEDIIDYLALKGVKSLHIEMQEQQLTEAEREKIRNRVRAQSFETGRVLNDEAIAKLKGMHEIVIPAGCKCAGKHDQIVHRGEPGAGEPVVVYPPVKAAPAPVVEQKAVEPPLEMKPVEPKPTPMPEPEKPAKPVAEKKAAPEPVKNAVTDTVAKTAGKPVYEVFCDMISADDGKVTAEERVALLNLMGLDDLLRVNNDFQLGLDTDKPVDDVRADVIECFK